MKICIATFYKITHPGAVLQAYALCRKLNEMGHETKLIKYPERDAPAPVPFYSLDGLYSIYTKSKASVAGYTRFIAEHCSETSRGYRTAEELRNDPPVADVYICGSDQIWNPKLTGGHPDPTYFLDYGDDAIKRISYAASYGGDALSEAHKELMKKWLNRFDSYSVREVEGQELIHELTGKEASLVQDPTLLIEDWASMATPSKPEGSYVLLYQLQKSPQVHAAAEAVAKRLGKPLLNIDASPKFWTRPGKDVRPSSPSEWLGLFKNAAAVVTNSFHGTVFSVLFHRSFYCIDLIGEKAKRAGRMKNLCDQLGLNERFISGDDPLTFNNVNWVDVEKRLSILRKASEDYLREAISQLG